MPSLVRSSKALSAQALEKLATSGLSLAQAKVLGFYSIDNAKTLDESFEARPALVLPYYDLDGKPLDMYRARYLGKAAVGFAQAAGAKEKRYVQPPGSPVTPYFCPYVKWKAVAEDTSIDLLITEGELKAAKACFEGFTTIGLGGVFSFMSKGQGLFFLPELEEIEWLGRNVYIVFDSDYRTNANICLAINRLGEELQARGALPHVISLPHLPDIEKTGLDDYLVYRGPKELTGRVKVADPLRVAQALLVANTELVYVSDPGLVIDIKTRRSYAPAHFTGHSEWAARDAIDYTLQKGELVYEQTKLAKRWLEWGPRAAASFMTYAPGREMFLEGDARAPAFNTWAGWGLEPKKGPIGPWTELLKFLFQDADEGFLDWFLDWCAYPLQYPGTKMFSAVIVYGRTQGTGKTLVGYTLGDIYGSNFTKVSSAQLHSQYNDWAENKQFILGDEISGSDKRAEADAIKTLITQEAISVNKKYISTYSLPDCANYYFTSNHPDSFFIEDKDRRYAVLEVEHEDPLPQEFYKKYDAWRKGGGAAHLFYHLLERKISTDFNPRGPAFSTSARRAMSDLGKSDLGAWCSDLAENPDAKLRLGQVKYTRDLFTARELLDMYEAETGQSGKVTTNGMARALAAAGFSAANKGVKIRRGGVTAKYFIVRNKELLKRAPLNSLHKNLDKQPTRDV